MTKGKRKICPNRVIIACTGNRTVKAPKRHALTPVTDGNALQHLPTSSFAEGGEFSHPVVPTLSATFFFIIRPAAAGPRPDLLGTEKEKGKETANLHTQIPSVRFCDLAGPNRFPERTSPKRGLARSPCSWGPSLFIGLTYLRSEGEGPGVHKRPMHRANHIVRLA